MILYKIVLIVAFTTVKVKATLKGREINLVLQFFYSIEDQGWFEAFASFSSLLQSLLNFSI